MIKKILPPLFLLLFLLGSVYALDCQYTEDVYQTQTQTIFYETGEELDYSILEFTDFTYGSPDQPYVSWGEVGYNFKVKNNHPSKRIELNVSFTKNGNLDSEQFTVDPLGYYIVGRGWNEVIDFNTIRYQFFTEGFTAESKEVEVLIDTICKVCNGKTCSDDGLSCETNSECGSSYCIQNICSLTQACYNNQCSCSFFEKQLEDNTGCEKDYFVIGVLLLIFFVITIGIVWRIIIIEIRKKRKAEKEKYETEIKLLEKRQEEIRKNEEELAILKTIKHAKEQEKKRIDNLEKDIQKKRLSMEEETQRTFETFMKPYPSKASNGQLVFKNPYLGGYECFYKEGQNPQNYTKGDLIHIWVWKKANNGRWPRRGYHIHHIDKEKYNNDISNLQEIEGEEHYMLHRNRL